MSEIINIELLTDDTLKTRMNQNIEILYVLNGRMELILEQQQYCMEAGDFVLVNANKKYRIDIMDEQLLGVCFEIDYSKLIEDMCINQILFWCNTVADKDEMQRKLRDLMDQTLNLHFNGTNEMKIRLKSLQYELIDLLVSNFMVKTIEEHSENLKNEDARIFEIRNYMHANYYKQLSLKELAEELHFSQGYLSRYIKQNLGMSFLEYLNNIRLFHAVDDLLYTDKRIIEVAVDNGYPTATSFNKAFKNCYSMTPTEYRTEMKGKNTAVKAKKENDREKEEKVKKYLKEKYQQSKQTKVETIKILEVDTTVSRILQTPWNDLVNAGDATMLFRADYQEHIKIICSKLKFKYIRIWNLLSLFMYSMEDGNIQTNFGKLDRVLDFLNELDLKLHIELSMKPQIFIAKKEEIIYYKETETISQTGQEYVEIINRLMLHLINRYGLEKVETWRFELWKDPRMDIQDADGMYYETFEAIYKVLKGYSSRILFGGPGIILGYENYLYEPIFDNWAKREIYPDFLSVYSYGYVTYQKDGNLYKKKSRDSQYTLHQLEMMRHVMDQHKFSVDNIYVTEWGYTISNRNVLNDGCNMGAYVLKNYLDAESNIDVLAYTQATDLFSEYYDTKAVLNGDLGLISKEGIRKPSFYALQFLQSLNKKVLGKNENAIVTANDKNEFVIVCHNLKQQTYQSTLKEENKLRINEAEIFENEESIQLDIAIKNIPDGEYRIKTNFVNQENGSVQDNWMRMGFPEELSEIEIEYLKMISVPHIKLENVLVKNQKLNIKICLAPHEIRMIKIDYHYIEE